MPKLDSISCWGMRMLAVLVPEPMNASFSPTHRLMTAAMVNSFSV